MINEVEMRRLRNRLDELDAIIDQYFTSGKHIPDEIRSEYGELRDKYNEMVGKIHQQKTKEFMEEISNTDWIDNLKYGKCDKCGKEYTLDEYRNETESIAGGAPFEVRHKEEYCKKFNG